MLRTFLLELRTLHEAEDRGDFVRAASLTLRLRAEFPPSFFKEAEKRGMSVPDYDRKAVAAPVSLWRSGSHVTRVAYVLAVKLLREASPRVAVA